MRTQKIPSSVFIPEEATATQATGGNPILHFRQIKQNPVRWHRTPETALQGPVSAANPTHAAGTVA